MMHRLLIASCLTTSCLTASCLIVGSAAATERVIDKEAVIPVGVDAVWPAWTTTEGIKSFFAPNGRVQAWVGGLFHISMDPAAARAVAAPTTRASWRCGRSAC